MEIGATKSVQERLKTTKIDEIKGASLVFCWDTHLTKIKGRNVLFIVNASLPWSHLKMRLGKLS